MTPPKKILFVCLGNICRSPAAEGIFRKFAFDAGLEEADLCDSCGTGGWHVGALPDIRMRLAAQKRGIILNHHSRVFQKADFKNFDLILTMDEDNFETVFSRANTVAAQKKIRPFVDYCRQSNPKNIPDPYYGDNGFDLVLDLLEEGCNALVAELKAN